MPIEQYRGRAAEFPCQLRASVRRIDDKLLIPLYYLSIFGEFLPESRENQGGLRRPPQPDVAAAEAFGPVDPVDRGIGAVAGGGEIGAEGSDAEHAAAIGEDPFPVAAGGGVKDLDLGVAARGVEAVDLAYALGVLGIGP